MKNISLLILLIIILAVASVAQKSFNKSEDIKNKKNLISAPTSSPTSKPTPTIVGQTKDNSVFQSSPSPAGSSNTTIHSIGSFIYPNSTVVFQSDSKLTLQSTDSPSKITDWYKERITSLNTKAKSFVQTSSNGNILNKLASANSLLKVEVEISKKISDSFTKIGVDIVNK